VAKRAAQTEKTAASRWHKTTLVDCNRSLSDWELAKNRSISPPPSSRQGDLCRLLRETFDLLIARYAATSFFDQLNFGSVDVLCARCTGVSFEQAADEPAIANGRREPRMQRYPAPTTTFHVNKVPIVAATEGRGAQDMVVLVLRRRIGRVRASHPHNGGNRRWTC
jgi:hypothetical protein